MISTAQLKEFLFENRISIFIFLCVGGSTAIFYFSSFAFLLKVMHLNYKIAISIAYVASVILYFFANRQLTFKNSNNPVAQQVPRFLMLLLLNYLITLAVMHVAVENLSLQPYFGLAASIGITCMISYTISRFWIFKAA